ncbi:MAG: D-aminoacyl-tRNA deacylase [Thermoanaerobaculia bacterium]
MILAFQRVSRASVRVAGQTVATIGAGLVVFGCVEPNDDPVKVDQAAVKTVELRIFEDEAGKMNRSVIDTGGAILAVSQFTLGADLSRGRRPGFEGAAPFALAEPLFESFVATIRAFGVPISTGVFRARMDVELVNEGPATFFWRTPGR